MKVPLGRIEVPQVDVRPSGDGGELGCEGVQGAAYTLAGTLLLEGQHRGAFLKCGRSQGRVPALAVVCLDEPIHVGGDARHISHTD
ncbi:hypothetical protein ACFYMR_22830 [Streptomyces albogriseolus]|uniref:hypothetical protein n=1 Tax=Streptomyces albogriseolus TaxID=1887 RepID=UPI003696925B